jgi:hypothetical protein
MRMRGTIKRTNVERTKRTKMTTLNETWLNGQYKNGDEINTYLPFVNMGEYSWHGEDAARIISEIHEIWNAGEMDQQEAVNIWKNRNDI